MRKIIAVILVLTFIFSACGRMETGGNSFTDAEVTLPSVTADSTGTQATVATRVTETVEIIIPKETTGTVEVILPTETTSVTESTEPAVTTQSIGNVISDEVQNKDESFVASWLSFVELSVNKSRDTAEEYSAYIDSIFGNMKEIGVTDVFIQVRPFADAFYSSQYFPSSVYVAGKQGGTMPFDVLALIIERAKLKNIDIHAWINPYRVSNEKDITALSQNNPAYIWYEQGNNANVAVTDSGIYFNPSSENVRQLIVAGARELMENYDIKGIHIDDYFYFEDCGDFDSVQYGEYVNSGGRLDLASWRRENVNCLLSYLYIAVKSYGEDKIFSVSPAGNTDKCYNEDYADIYSWCRKDGYCDMIIPQIYFGFLNEKQPFEACLSQWLSLCENSNVRLVIGLGLYKSGTEDTYALSGKNEWIENTDIISRQVQIIKDKNCDGFALYSGTYINFSETFLSEELNNLKNVL